MILPGARVDAATQALTHNYYDSLLIAGAAVFYFWRKSNAAEQLAARAKQTYASTRYGKKHGCAAPPVFQVVNTMQYVWESLPGSDKAVRCYTRSSTQVWSTLLTCGTQIPPFVLELFINKKYLSAKKPLVN